MTRAFVHEEKGDYAAALADYEKLGFTEAETSLRAAMAAADLEGKAQGGASDESLAIADRESLTRQCQEAKTWESTILACSRLIASPRTAKPARIAALSIRSNLWEGKARYAFALADIDRMIASGAEETADLFAPAAGNSVRR